MIDWNKNGKIDPVDIGITIAVSQEKRKEAIAAREERPTLSERLLSWLKRKQR